MLTLAALLRSLEDDQLAHSLRLRGVSATGIRDFFDLAEALLAPDAIQDALARLDRPTLAALAGAIEPSPERLERLTDLLLVGPKGAPFELVERRIAAWPAEGLPSATQLLDPEPEHAVSPTTADEISDSLGAERAFATVSQLAELIAELSTQPARELSKGGLSVPDAKRLALTMGIELEQLPPRLSLAAHAGLIAQDGSLWLDTELGENWLRAGSAARWNTLCAAWLDTLPSDVREMLTDRATLPWGEALHGHARWRYPAGGEWMETRLRVAASDAELLGITAGELPTTTGRTLLREGLEAASAALGARLPGEVDGVYVQHDLSIVSPGPLRPELDARLRLMADVESRELAASYRVTAASLNRALAAGETAAGLLSFLEEISLTGVPQPLNYLVVESAARYGRVRVGTPQSGETPAQSYVRSDDDQLLGTIEVDQTLSHLGLHRTGPHRLVSRIDPGVLFWALSDARYPVAAENSDGDIVRLSRHRVAPRQPVEPTDAIAELVVQLRASAPAGESAAHAWLARQLDVAIRSKATLIVTVNMPAGPVELLLEPTGVAGGRLRGRDRKADIERTLPLSSIASISPA